MNDTELEAWLASRLGSAPSPEPSPRLVALVHAGRRPGGAPTRKLSLTMPGWLPTGRRRVAGLVGLAACVALAGGLLLGMPARISPSSGVSSSPSINPTGSPSASPRPSASPTPTAMATAVEATAVQATVVARVADCQNPLGWDYVVSGNDLFVVCEASNSPSSNAGPGGAYVARVDLTTNKVTATYRYKTAMTYIENMTVDGGSLWFEGTFGSACAAPCNGFRHIERFDVDTGKNTLDLPNLALIGGAFGYAWVSDKSAPMATGVPLRKLDPKTGQEKGSIPFNIDRAQFACGSLWGMTTSGAATSNTSTTVARIDPADGSILAQFTVPGLLSSLQSVGDQCWASVAPGGADPYTADHADHFIRIGNSGVEYTSPLFDLKNQSGSTSETYVDIQGGSFWLVSDDGVATATLQRLDPSTWQPAGTRWQVAAYVYQGDPFAIIGGSVWAFDTNGGISRLDIPLGS
jgi:hypothetical protein